MRPLHGGKCKIEPMATLLWLFSTSLLAQADVPQASPAEKVAAAVAELASETFERRESATQFLWRAWPASKPALEAAAKSSDAEVALRARHILEQARYGLAPDTPPEIVRLTRDYRQGDANAKRAALGGHRERGQTSIILALLRNESDKNIQAQWAQEFLNLEKASAVLLVAGEDPSRAIETLQWLAEFGNAPARAQRDLAALLLLTGGLDKAIAERQAAGLYRDQPREAALLARLLQVQGNLPQAREIAEFSKDKHLQSDLYYRLEDWQALTQAGFIPGDSGIENLGFTAAYQRLAGNNAELNLAIQGILALAASKPERAWMCAEALMINGRWQEALDLLTRAYSAGAFDLLATQLRCTEAFQRIGIDKPREHVAEWFTDAMRGLPAGSRDAAPLFHRGCKAARVLHGLGEREQSLQLIAALDKAAGSRPDWSFSVFALQLDVGLMERAWQQGAQVIQNNERSMPSVMSHLYGSRSSVAREWWSILQDSAPDESPLSSLRKLEAILSPQPRIAPLAANVAALARQAEQAAEKLPLDPRLRRLAAIADVCLQHKELPLARSCLEKQAALAGGIKEERDPFGERSPRGVEPLVRLGLLEAEQGAWLQAAAAYGRAWELDKRNAVPLYFQGHALVQAGKDGEGRRLMERAVLLPLAGTEPRRDLARAMQARGLASEALSQWEIILRVGAFEGWEGGDDWAVQEAAENVARHVNRSDELRAAFLWQRYLFYMLKTNTGFLEAGHYARAVHRIHACRALGLLKSGQTQAALSEVWKAHAALPGEADFVAQVLPLLASGGHRKDAERLFEESFSAYDAVCRAFPRSSRHHNGLAWLAARCSQRLDAALAHAHEALCLEPGNPAFLDTLAEVHFQRGDRAAALTLATKAAELTPTNQHFQEQLRRFREAR
jgi:hypothetical protein